MARLSHSPARAPAAFSVGELLARATRRLARARLHYGHGTAQPRDDAAALIWHVMKLPPQSPASVLKRAVSARAQTQIEALMQRRIRERIPVVYLTHQCWFAGVPLYVDERVLIPRSPIAELIEQRFQPWIDPARVQRVLDLGTGSGCIAVACARAFPRARVDAIDISQNALDVARINVRRLRLSRRVRVLQSNHFEQLGDDSYDIIVSNPPYVGRGELAGLPAEYHHEPRLALAAGTDGLDSVRIILREAAAHLRPGGLLVVEVGNTQTALQRAWPKLPMIWLDFERGGGGVFLIQREQLAHGRRQRD